MTDLHKKIENAIILCDFFSTSVNFKLNNKPIFSSILGGLLSIFSISVILIFAWLFGKDVFFHKNPSLIVINGYHDFIPAIEFNINNTFLAYRVEDYNGNAIPDVERYFDIEAYYETDIKVSSGESDSKLNYIQTITIANQSDCYYYTNTKFSSFFPESELKRLRCFKDLKYNLSGVWGNSLSFLNLKVKYCVNSTLNSNSCYPKDQIIQFTSGNFFSFYYSNSIIDSTDYENPFTFINKNSYTLLSPLLFKYAELYYKSTNIITDTGFFIFSQENQTLITPDVFSADVGEFDSNYGYLIQINFYFSAKYDTFIRQYIKIQNIFANLGGVIQVVFLLGKYLIYPLSEKMMNSVLINQLFEVHIEKTGDNSNPILNKESNASFIEEFNTYLHLNHIRKASESQNPLELIRENASNQPESTQKKINETSKNEMKKFMKNFYQKNKLVYHWWELLTSKICSKKIHAEELRRKDKIYKICIDEVNKYLNINFLFEKIQEIDILKYLLFTQEQLYCFNLFQKPQVSWDKTWKLSEFSEAIKESKGVNENTIINIIKFIERVDINKNNENELEKKICNLLNQKLRIMVKK